MKKFRKLLGILTSLVLTITPSLLVLFPRQRMNKHIYKAGKFTESNTRIPVNI